MLIEYILQPQFNIYASGQCVCVKMSVLRSVSAGDHCNVNALRADYTTVRPSQQVWRKGRTIVSAPRGID